LFHKIRDLSKDLAIYGIGDVAVSIINFLLLPIYVRYLSATDYGVLAQLGAAEVIAKILFRCGLDGSFMRFHYEYDGARDRQRLASTIFFFLLAVDLTLLTASVLAAPGVAGWLFTWDAQVPDTARAMHVLALRLVLANTAVMGLMFLPFQLMRIEKRAATFSMLTLTRSVSTLLLRILFVMQLGLGVLGLVAADLIVTALTLVLVARSFSRLVRLSFSVGMLRDSLAFGLPRVPHAFAQQLMAVGDRLILPAFRSLGEIGIYSMGASFALTQKLFLSAFESAWAPFYYATAREPDGRRVFAAVTTYAVAVLAVTSASLSAVAADVLALMVGPVYAPAAGVIPWIALGVLLQGVYLLTSIGLNITKQTRYYPVATASAAIVSVILNLALIPRYGIFGAARANAAAYGVQAALAFWFSQRVYPVSYEWPRLLRVCGAATLGYLIASSLPPMPPLAGVAVRGLGTLGVTGAVLALTGFFRPAELALLRKVSRRGKRTPLMPRAPAETTEFAGEIITSEPADRGPESRRT
jgi:O-antigen/teichoic acid export membrane protein